MSLANNLMYFKIFRASDAVTNTRVATDLENLEKSGNLKETSESQGICDRIPKVREFCCLKFIFSQTEDPNFENFLGEHAPRPP